jgi:Mrp family chromosome partitioning ATPase/capsular polysaccharide biosynthesis protein
MISMKIVVRALVRWFWVLILCVLIGWLGGKKLATLFPPQYQATALIQLNMQSNTSAIVQPVAAYASLVTSDSVLGATLKNYPDLDRQTMSAKQLIITNDPKSQTISIQVALPNAREAASVANGLAHLLVAQQNAYIQQQYTNELKLLDGRIADEQKSINTLNQQIILLSTDPAKTTAMQQDQNQVTQLQNLQNQNVSLEQGLRTQQALDSNPLSVVQEAIPPSKPSSIIGVIPFAPAFLGLMLILGMIVIFLLEREADHINGVYSLQKQLALPVLGSLRWISPGPNSKPLRALVDSREPYAEDCRIMMADVLFHAEEAHAHILAITGSKAQSGSSTIAWILAALLAQSKRRVLLIDANLHEPTQNKRLEVSNNAGLASMLEEARHMKVNAVAVSGQEPVEMYQQTSIPGIETQGIMGARKQSSSLIINPQRLNSVKRAAIGASDQKIVDLAAKYSFGKYIVPTRIQDLYVLPAGRPTMNPNNLLSMPEMDYFLKWSSKRVDFIVVDCPALIHAEAHVLGALSDQTLLVVDATKDRQKQVLNAKEKLLSTGVKLSGIIVNKLGRWV